MNCSKLAFSTILKMTTHPGVSIGGFGYISFLIFAIA